MKRAILPFIFLISIIISNSCSTDFDMYAEYKDVTIVYGIADISDDTTWIKITKAFTGPGNALVIAQDPDSSNYPYKLDAIISGKKNGVELTPIQLDTITIHTKALADTNSLLPNPFYAPDQLMYYAAGSLDDEATYTLTINKHDGSMTASTGIVSNFSIIKPNSRFAFPENTDGSIEWNSARNGIRNELSLRFNYLEYISVYPDTLHKYVEWSVGVYDAKSGNGSERMTATYSGPNFYKLLNAELEPIPNVERWADSVYITIACGSQVLSTYIDINAGGGSLLEEVPVYSNIEGGSGIFASRHTVMKPVRLSLTTERTLVENEDYEHLGFKFKNY